MININIEPADFCNSRCTYCILGTQRFSHGQQGGLLSCDIHDKLFTDFDDFVDDPASCPHSDSNIYLRYCGVGEPTLNPSFIKMFKTGLCYPRVRQVAVLSNGAGWTSKMADEFIEVIKQRPDQIIELVFSLDTIRPATQVRIKKLDSIAVTLDQMLYLLDEKAKQGMKNMHPVFQMIILDENYSEVDEFVDYWSGMISKRGLSVRVVGDPTYPEFFRDTDCFIWLKIRDADTIEQVHYFDLHKRAFDRHRISAGSNGVPVGARQESSEGRSICGVFWQGINIFANGDISPCCIDTNLDLKIGNLREQSLKDIYLSLRMQKLRQAHLDANFEDFPLCRDCSLVYKGLPVSQDDIGAYISSAKRMTREKR